jgi:hypothetical protein
MFLWRMRGWGWVGLALQAFSFSSSTIHNKKDSRKVAAKPTRTDKGYPYLWSTSHKQSARIRSLAGAVSTEANCLWREAMWTLET